MTPPHVSVVMIFKDAAAYLAEAAASVLGQTADSVELVLVDDGGTDGSDGIARALAGADRRARVLSHPGRANLGMGASRALGAAQARGELVAFLDGDDRWDAGHLAHETSLLQAHPQAGMVCGRAWRWHSWRDSESADELMPLAFAPGVVVPPPRLLAAVLRQGLLTVPTCSLLVRSELLRTLGAPAVAFRGMYEDQALNALLQLSVPAVMSGTSTAWYRQHDASASAEARRLGMYHPVLPNNSRRQFLTWLAGRPELSGCGDEEVVELVRAAEASQEPPPPPALVTRAAQSARRRLPPRLIDRTRDLVRPRGVGRVRLGSLAGVAPVSRQFGYDRGTPVDRFYVEGFLARWAEDVRGSVLEVGDAAYTRRFGGGRVTSSHVLNVREGVPGTTVVADLADGRGLPSGAYDCVVLTQTLHFVFDVHAAARTLHRVLRPGGVLLLTVPGISPLSDDEWESTWHWSFTRHSARRLLGQVFSDENVHVEQHGNALTATAFVQGIAVEELPERHRDLVDLQFPVTVAVRAVRPVSGS